MGVEHRPTLFLQRASGTLLKPNIKDIAVSVEDDPHESVTYTRPDPRKHPNQKRRPFPTAAL
jgi:hypothetical protein